MLVPFLALTAITCGTGWFFSRITIKTILCFMEEKKHTLPTDEELKACTKRVVEETLTLRKKSKH